MLWRYVWLLLFCVRFACCFLPLGLPGTPGLQRNEGFRESWEGKAGKIGFQVKRVVEPLVILPGTPGSFLEARFTNVKPPHPYCRRNQDWHKVWPSKEVIVPGFEECFLHNIMIHYDAATNQFSNTEGVEIRPIDYGGFNGTYFDEMVANFTAVGYEIGKTLFGAPFDWRADMRGWGTDGSYAQLQTMIEKAFTLNNNTKVHLLGHSGGSLYGHFFLTRYVTQEWKEKYVKTFITMGGPWLGSATTYAYLANLTALANGQKFPKTLLNFYETFTRSLGLMVSFMPPEKYTSQDPLLITSTKTYTGANGLGFLELINATQLLAIRKNNIDDYNQLLPPQIEMHCLYGYGFDTPNTFVYSSPDFSRLKAVLNTTGDSVVSTESFSFCTKWRSQQTQPIFYQGFFNVSHSLMQNSPDIWSYILNVTTHN